MMKAELQNCMTDPQYRPVGPKSCQRLGIRPHHALYSETSKRLLVFLKKGAGLDYSTNTEMVKSVCALQQQDKVGQVYLVQRDNNEIIAWETAKNVERKINGVAPRKGEYGPFVWLQEKTFNVVGGNTAWPDEELPF